MRSVVEPCRIADEPFGVFQALVENLGAAHLHGFLDCGSLGRKPAAAQQQHQKNERGSDASEPSGGLQAMIH
jgi:hypothetical protein